MTKILRAVGATFVYKMWGTSRHHAKFTGDHGSAIEVIRISDRSLRSVFAKNFEPCNFRLLQPYRHESDQPARPLYVRFRGQERTRLCSDRVLRFVTPNQTLHGAESG